MSGCSRSLRRRGDGRSRRRVFLPSGSPASYNGDSKPRLLPRALHPGEAGTGRGRRAPQPMVRKARRGFLDGRIGSQSSRHASVGAWLAGSSWGRSSTARPWSRTVRAVKRDAIPGSCSALTPTSSNLRVGAGQHDRSRLATAPPSHASATQSGAGRSEARPATAAAARRDGDGVYRTRAPGRPAGKSRPCAEWVPPPAVPPPLPAASLRPSRCRRCADRDRDRTASHERAWR